MASTSAPAAGQATTPPNAVTGAGAEAEAKAKATANSKDKVTLTGPQETLMATLYLRACDAALPKPILNDRWATQVASCVAYDFSKTGMSPGQSASVAVRARVLDRWTAEFLGAHAFSSETEGGEVGGVTVLHLGCGLDARAHRVLEGQRQQQKQKQKAAPAGGRNKGKGRKAIIRWVDLDLPGVVELRRKLLPDPEAEGDGDVVFDYTLLAASAAEVDAWIEDVPADRPTAVVFEGLSMYLREEDGKTLVQRLVEHFSVRGGQLLFDAFSPFACKMGSLFVPAVRKSGSTLHWGIADPKALEGWCPSPSPHRDGDGNGGPTGLRLRDALNSVDLAGEAEYPLGQRVQLWLASVVPGLKNLAHILRYEF